MLEIAPEKLAAYQASAQRRQENRHQQLLERQAQGWTIAHQAAHLLKSQFGATRVVLFGSLLNVERMHSRSDIDLAVWGINERDYFRAVSQLLNLSDFSVDLVEAENTSPKLLNAIQEAGVDL
ncbi:nucleotidyltransferase family protein [Phormidesmis priestleyi]